ncbi:hypothetical protein TNCV_3325231 [Trichonephila clavipes]|nr:hypothetical protein TNCV_3325231 [Trichonephila clavipes]
MAGLDLLARKSLEHGSEASILLTNSYAGNGDSERQDLWSWRHLSSSSIYLVHHRKLISLFSVAPYWRIPIVAGRYHIGEYQSPQYHFDAPFPSQGVIPELWRCETVLRILILSRTPKPNRHTWDLLRAAQSCNMATVDFQQHENPPTWAGVEPATFGVQGQRQINYATQPACIRNWSSIFLHRRNFAHVSLLRDQNPCDWNFCGGMRRVLVFVALLKYLLLFAHRALFSLHMRSQAVAVF